MSFLLATTVSDKDVLLDLIERFGIFGVVFIAILIMVWRYLPKFLDMQLQKIKVQQDNEVKRHDQADSHISIISKLTEQSNQIIAQNTTAMERNSEVFREAVTTNKQVVQSLIDVTTSIHSLSEKMDSHDKRAEQMHIEIIKMATIIKSQ